MLDLQSFGAGYSRSLQDDCMVKRGLQHHCMCFVSVASSCGTEDEKFVNNVFGIILFSEGHFHFFCSHVRVDFLHVQNHVVLPFGLASVGMIPFSAVRSIFKFTFLPWLKYNLQVADNSGTRSR